MMTKEQMKKLDKGYHPNVRLMDKHPSQGKGKSRPDVGRIDRILSKLFPNPINDQL